MRFSIVAILFCFFLCCKHGSQVSRINFESFKKEPVIYGFENEANDSSQMVIRQDTNQVVFSLFGRFNDTIVLYVNQQERMKWPVSSKNQPSSSDYTGIDFGILFDTNVSTTIYLKLINEKVYIPLSIDKSYPLCTIHRIGNIWHVNFRKRKLIIL